jgi:ABC-type dipeptide/oligopeptide/nickel transport system ATPase component
MRSIRNYGEGDDGPLLTVAGLNVEFPTRHGTLRAVHDVSFDIGPGEILGVVGESGAGKSVTGAAIIGLVDPPGRIAQGESASASDGSTTCRTTRCARYGGARSARSSRTR